MNLLGRFSQEGDVDQNNRDSIESDHNGTSIEETFNVEIHISSTFLKI